MTQFESGVKIIPYSQERVYEKVSNLNHLAALKDKLPDKVKDLSCDTDTVSISVDPAGSVTMKIVDREPCKCVKFETTQSPIPCNFWIQILPLGENQCKIKLTLKAELNFFIKGMVSKPLQEGIEKLAEVLAVIPY